MKAARSPSPGPLGVVDELLEDWRISIRARGRSLATIQSYLAVGTSFAAYLEEVGAAKAVDAIARGQIEAYLAGMRERGLSAATVAKHYRSLQQLFVWLLEEGEISPTYRGSGCGAVRVSWRARTALRAAHQLGAITIADRLEHQDRAAGAGRGRQPGVGGEK